MRLTLKTFTFRFNFNFFIIHITILICLDVYECLKQKRKLGGEHRKESDKYVMRSVNRFEKISSKSN